MNLSLQTFCEIDREQTRLAMGDVVGGHCRPLLVHLHIPKCAGTSFNHLLDRSFGQKFVPIYSRSPGSCFSEKELVDHLGANLEMLATASHSIRIFPRRLGNRVPLYVMFLRDPLEWVISNITYLIHNYHQLSDAHRATLPQDCAAMSVKQLLLYLRERNLREGRPPLDVLHYLTAPTVELQVTLIEQPDLLQLGKHLIDQCFFVGLVERLPQSIDQLREKLRAVGLSLSDQEMPALNTSREARGDLSWLNSDDELGARVLSGLSRDRALYQHAADQFGR